MALHLSRTFGYPLEEAANLVELGDTVRLQGEYGLAQELLERGWALAQEISAYSHASHAVEALGCLYNYLGDYGRAQRWLDQRRALESSVEFEPGVAHALLALQQGAYRQALDAAAHTWQWVSRSGNRSARAKTLVVIGHAQAGLQQWTAATDTYVQVLALYTAVDKPIVAIEARAGLAAVALEQGDLATALQQVEALLPVLTDAPYWGASTNLSAPIGTVTAS